MAKVAACNIQPGMKFKIISQDGLLPFAMQIGKEGKFDGGVNVRTGTDLIITKAPYMLHGQLVNFKIDGTEQEFCAYWSVFKTNTELIEGEVKDSRPAKQIFSNGQFNGFDIKVMDVKLEDYTGLAGSLGQGVILLKFGFLGSAEGFGKKKPNTKLINIIKSAPGFKEKFIELINDAINDNINEVNKLIAVARCPSFSHGNYTTYSGGNLLVHITLIGEPLNNIQTKIEQLADAFINSKSSSARI